VFSLKNALQRAEPLFKPPQWQAENLVGRHERSPVLAAFSDDLIIA
jgi:hypothetical protein